MKVVIVIPARYASSRLPGKPLADIHGKPMVQHVYEKAQSVRGCAGVVVATDDHRICDRVLEFGGQAVMTSSEHESGTDRLVEVMHHYPADVYINLQGDEPLVRPGDIEKLIQLMERSEVRVGTLFHAISHQEAVNPNSVKVVLGNEGQALYFSRSPIPYPRSEDNAQYYKHVGVYAYKSDVLAEYTSLSYSMPEQAEMLEQLRLLSAGIPIHAVKVDTAGPGVDTPECLDRVRSILAGHPVDEKTNPLATTRLVITDVDGVLTDGSIFYDSTGECIKRFHVRDGLGIRLLEESGIKVAVLSGRDSETLRKRITDLGINHFMLGVKDKFAACRELMAMVDAKPDETVCIGDDSIDLPAFEACGFSFVVADAEDYVQQKADYILSKAGGSGAFREVADMILKAQGKEEIATSADGFKKIMAGAAQ